MDKCDEMNEVIDYLKSWDVKPTKENMRRVLEQWISNLYSQIGTEAHEHALACGVEDLTGLTWEEQDIQALRQIGKYKRCLALI